jgi:F-type H+-transporting ATPase subunit epsilon
LQNDKLKLRFTTPTDVLFAESKKNHMVDQVMIPAESGVLGIMPNYAPLVAQLRPGPIAVYSSKDQAPERFFVSGGFCIVQPDSVCSITVAEAVKIDDLDPQLVASGLSSFQAAMDKATDPKEKAKAQIGHEVHTMMQHALEDAGKK